MVELHESNILVREEIGQSWSSFGVAKIYENQGHGSVQNVGNIYAQDTRQMILTTDVVVHVSNHNINFYKKRNTRLSFAWQPFTSDDYGSVLSQADCVICGPTLDDCKVLAETFCGDDTDGDCYISAYDDGTFAITDEEDDYYFDDGTEGSPTGYTIEWVNITTITEPSYYRPQPSIQVMAYTMRTVGTTGHGLTSTTRVSVVDTYYDTNGVEQKFRLIVADPVAIDSTYSPTIALYKPDLTVTDASTDARGFIQQWSGAAWGVKGKEDWLVVCTDHENGGVKQPALRLHKWNGTAYEQEAVANIDNFIDKFSKGTNQLCKGGVEHNMDLLLTYDDANNVILNIFLQDLEMGSRRGGVHYIQYSTLTQSYTYKQTLSGEKASEFLGKQVHVSDDYLLLSAPTQAGQNNGGWRLYGRDSDGLYAEVDSHINEAQFGGSTHHEIGVDIDLSSGTLAISGNVDSVLSTALNYGTKVYDVLEQAPSQGGCATNQFYNGQECRPCEVLKSSYQSYSCCATTYIATTKLNCEMNNVPCRLCQHLWTEWHESCNSCNTTLGGYCDSNPDCQSDDCRGGMCCSPFLNDPNCAACGANGFCANCIANHAYNVTSGKCDEIVTTAAGGTCAANNDCTSGYCLTNCCSSATNYNGCATCDTSGNCGACQANKTWTAGIGCQ